MNSFSAVRMQKVAYAGWPNCIQVSNGQIELIATTDVGPRIIRFGFVGGPNLFSEVPEHLGKTGGDEWKSYGGHRLWHAPEVMPRSYVPDNSSIEHVWDGRTLKLIQPVEASTGLQKEIEITLDEKANRVSVLHRIRNKNGWAIEAAPWALSVMRGPGTAIFPQELPVDQLLPVRPLVLWGYTDMRDARWTWGTKFIQLRSDPAADKPQKFGIMNTLGWAAYAREETVFIKRFNFDPKAVYPDFGCNTESYTRGDMIEVETVGPLRKIESGAFVEHVEHWFLFKCKIGGTDDELEAQLAPLIKNTQ